MKSQKRGKLFQTNSAWSNGLTIELNTKDEKLWF